MFNYQKLYEPYAIDGATINGTISWLMKTTKLPSEVVEQAFQEIMLEVADGKVFSLPCPCGCGMTNAHTPLEHAMRKRAVEISNDAIAAYSRVIIEREKRRVEERMKKLRMADKTMIKAAKKERPSWFARTFKKKGIRE
jgi:hypothetical protein